MVKSVEALPPYPSAKARATLSPSQAAKLHQTISSRLAQTLGLPAAQSNTAATLAFLASYVKDSAQLLLNSLIWEQSQGTTQNIFANLSPVEKTIRQRVFLLAERLAASGFLDIQLLLDLSVVYGSTNPTRFRKLFSTAFSHNRASLESQVKDVAVCAFTTLFSNANAQGLYGLRKTTHIVLSFLRPAPAELTRLFAQDKYFMTALARAYDHALGAIVQSYGGLNLRSASDTPLDDWERLFLETKAALVDSFHVLIRALLADVAAQPGRSADAAFEVVFGLLDVPPFRPGGTTPFLDRPLVADYQHAYDLSRTLQEALKSLEDPRGEALESALRALDVPLGEGSTSPGALKLLLVSSGVQPGIDARGRGPSASASYSANSKGKGRATSADVTEPNPALDAAVAQVLDVLPDLPAPYVRFLLESESYPYRGDAERLLGALLEGTAPSQEEVDGAIRTAGPTSSLAQASPQDGFVYTRERRNVFDGQKIDMTSVRVGKKRYALSIAHATSVDLLTCGVSRDDAETLLQDRSFAQEMKAEILRRAEEAALADEDEDEDLDGYGAAGAQSKAKGRDVAFEGELDDAAEGAGVKVRDGDESELDGSEGASASDGDDDDDDDDDREGSEARRQSPEMVLELAYLRDAKLLERDGQTRRSKARAALREQTGWTDEQIEGWKIMLERNVRISLLRIVRVCDLLIVVAILLAS